MLLDLLRRIRSRIEKPENWTQNYFAKAADGKRVGVYSPYAVCWCLHGAVSCESACIYDHDAAMNALHACLPQPYKSIWDFNDNSSHSAVLALVDRAIEGEVHDSCSKESA